MSNYLHRFGLEYNPFIKNNSANIKLELDSSSQMIFRLNHLLESRGIGVFTGEPGLGKTTTLRFWANTLNKNVYKVIYIPHSTLNICDFYKQLCDELKLDIHHSKRINFKNIQHEINRLFIEKKITPIIIIDEANYLSSNIINDLKIIFNFDMDSKEPFILILTGQNELRDILNRRSNEAFKQRITTQYTLQPLEVDESIRYINEKLKIAGLNTTLFTEQALNFISKASNGIPRIINRLCEKSLLLLENQKLSIIDDTVAMNAFDEINI